MELTECSVLLHQDPHACCRHARLRKAPLSRHDELRRSTAKTKAESFQSAQLCKIAQPLYHAVQTAARILEFSAYVTEVKQTKKQRAEPKTRNTERVALERVQMAEHAAPREATPSPLQMSGAQNRLVILEQRMFAILKYLLNAGTQQNC